MAQTREYPVPVADGYLYHLCATQQQCQWTASGSGGCALNPRLLFLTKPADSGWGLPGARRR